MEVRNCRGCGRLFNWLSGPSMCQNCKDELEKRFQDVKEYVRENPRSSLSEIADANGVTTQQIQQWVREERLQFAEDSPIGLACELCGGTIRTGRFCEACKKNMATGFAQSIAKPVDDTPAFKAAKHDNKMRFI